MVLDESLLNADLMQAQRSRCSTRIHSVDKENLDPNSFQLRKKASRKKEAA